MSNKEELENKFKEVQTAFESNGYNRYSGYYTFSVPSDDSYYAVGKSMKSVTINTMVSSLKDNQYGINYTTFPINNKTPLVDHISILPQSGNDIFNGLNQYISIECDARNCEYNCNGMCASDNVKISGPRSTETNETKCQTFTI